LIDFFNTQAFTEKYSSSNKRRPPDPVPENKVKSLVINFTRLESLSAPATAATSPIKSKNPPTPWRRSRPASEPDSRATPAKSILKPLKHVSYKLDPISRDVGDVEEITVSGGDRRETTYKKSQEPLRTVKVWKEQYEPRADQKRWADSGRGKEPPERPFQEPRVDQKRWADSGRSREPEKQYQERVRDSKNPNYGTIAMQVLDDGSQSFVSGSSPPGKWRRKGKSKSKRAGDGSDRSSTSQSYTTPPIESPVEQVQSGWNSRGLKSPPATTIIPTPSTAYVTSAKPWNERTKAPVAVTSADYRVLKAPKGPSAIAMEPLSSKYPSLGKVKDSLTTTFGGTMRQNSMLRNDGASSSKQRSPTTKAKDDSWIKRDKAIRRRVPADFETSQSEASNITPEPPKNRKPISRGKTPLIITTEASPSESGFPDIDSVVQQVMSNPPSLLTGPESTLSAEYSTVKQPRTFKDIALQRREERKKAQELVPPESDDHGRLSVPSMSAPTPVAPLRVVKPKDPDVPTIQNPVPLKQLYSKASQDTLTSFEEPSIEVSDSSDGSEEEDASNLRSTPSPAIELQYHRPSGEELRPPMRSPSLMREMAPPRLTLRTTSSMSHTSVSKADESSKKHKHKHKRPALTQQHFAPASTQQNFAPRMKLKRDDEWMAVARNRQQHRRLKEYKNGSGDGPDDIRTRTAQSSTSHDTTVSSSIVAKKVVVRPRPLKNLDESQTQYSGREEPRDRDRDRDRRQREGDVGLMSSMRVQRSKVNFSSFTQNFPADEYESGRRVGDRTTAIDGVDEANPIIASSRVKVGGGLKGKIQKFEEGGSGSARKSRKKKPKDRPRMG
jgi:hypothetical protein